MAVLSFDTTVNGQKLLINYILPHGNSRLSLLCLVVIAIKCCL